MQPKKWRKEKSCHIQSMLTSVKPAHSTVDQGCIFYNKGMHKNSDHTNNGIHYCSYCLK